jgi:hypothetical protein
MKSNTFSTWLIRDKFTIILTLACTFIPFLVPFIWKIITNNHAITSIANESFIKIILDFSTIIFIIIVLWWILGKSNFLKSDKEQQRTLLHDYVINEFGSKSELALENEDDLFKRMHTDLKQFYYGWVVVWTTWLILYTNKFIFMLYNDVPFFQTLQAQQINNFIDNFINLFNTCAFFFIYMVVTISTVNHSASDNSRGQMHIGIIILGLLWFMCSMIDTYSTVFTQEKYYDIQFFIKLFTGIFATISFMAVLGRFNSNYLNLPQWVVMCLYVYASVQILYPLTMETINGKSIFPLVDSRFSIFLLILAFIGKMLFFVIIRWIMKDNRFLCFMLHKANAMSESNDILKNFNLQYKTRLR